MSITAGRFGNVGSTKHLEKKIFWIYEKSNTKMVMEVNDDVFFKKKDVGFFREQWYRHRGQTFCLKPNSKKGKWNGHWFPSTKAMIILKTFTKISRYQFWWAFSPNWTFSRKKVVNLCKNGTLQLWWSKGFFRFGFNAWKLQFIFALFGRSLLLEEFWNVFRPEL